MMKKGALFCLKGFIREPKPTKKGIRATGHPREFRVWGLGHNMATPKRSAL